MFFALLDSWRKTLRFRLTVWNATVILATALLVLFGVRTGVQIAIQYEMDQVLIEDVYEIELALADAGATPASVEQAVQDPQSRARVRVVLDEFDRKALGHENHGWFAHLRSPSGELLWTSQQAPADIPPLIDIPDFRPHPRPGQRVVQSRRTTRPFSQLYVQVGISTHFLERAMAHIDQLVFLAAGLMLVTAGPTGYWLAGRTIQPLAVITQATSRYHPEKLDERLQIRGVGDELDQLAITINGLLDRLAAYVTQHRDFLANSAHELRTPLAAIRAAVEVALDGDRANPRSGELLGGVLEQCSALEMLVNQLLLLAETENERLRVGVTTSDFSAIVTTACQIFQAVADARELTLLVRIQPGLLVEVNPHHLRQVVNNLLDNALKFTPSGNQVVVELTVSSNHQALLRVKDTGEGMTPEDAERVFDRFFRADRARTHDSIQRGTGLGLSICRAIVEAHGGTIEVESTLGRGSCFTVRMPLHTPAADGERSRASGQDASQVLVSRE